MQEDGTSDQISGAGSLSADGEVSPVPDINDAIETMRVSADENQISIPDAFTLTKKKRKKLAMAANFEDLGLQ